jgi:pimeloyl-ACP methyl ester carboxylesterase
MAGCGSPYKSKRLDVSDLFKQKGRNAVNSDTPSWETRQYLRLMFLDEAYRKDSGKLIGTLEQMARTEPTPELRTALAELAILKARSLERTEPQKAETYYMVAAIQSYDYLFSDNRSLASSPLIPAFRFMADIYNLAVSKVIIIQNAKPEPWKSKDFDYEGIKYHFEVVKNEPEVWNPEVFDSIYNSYEVRVSGIENDYVSKGLGAPLVGIVDKPSEKAGFGRFYPKRLLAYPISAVLFFEPMQKTDAGLSKTIRLAFYDSDRTVPLEADFTKPLGMQVRNINPSDIGLHNLLKSNVAIKDAGIYMLEPYRPDKIPVVMVHGLISTPEKWVPMFNDLRGDAELRKHYQFWFFMYPTGLPIAYSASILRNQLNDIRAVYDPDGSNPNFNKMILIGHSMGGLLSRLMVQDSGTKYWDTYFKEPFETIALEPNLKEIVKDSLFFNHLPYVKQVIFVATPHKGSPMADKWTARIGSDWIVQPKDVLDAGKRLFNKQVVKESVTARYTKQVPDSISLLSPSSPFMKATNEVPLRPDIFYYSIIGIRDAKTGPGSSDGVVPYESSHLDFVKSEKLVPSDHSAQRHPLAVAEVKRILREHLE